jgi:hypothetical protein
MAAVPAISTTAGAAARRAAAVAPVRTSSGEGRDAAICSFAADGVAAVPAVTGVAAVGAGIGVGPIGPIACSERGCRIGATDNEAYRHSSSKKKFSHGNPPKKILVAHRCVVHSNKLYV